MSKIQERTIAGVTFKAIRGDPEGPSIIFFHGYGADENDLISLSQTGIHFSIKPNFFFPRGFLEIPIAPGYQGRGWFPIDIELLHSALYDHNPEEMEKAFEEFTPVRTRCEAWIEELHIPPHKLFIGGFSQGALLATDIALHAQENIGGLIIFSGMLIQKSAWASLAVKHKGLSFFQSHGKQDSLLPFDRALALKDLLTKKGLIGTWHPFEGGHEIPHSILLKLHDFFRKIFS